MTRQQLFTATLLLGISALPAMPAFAAKKPELPKHTCDTCGKIGPGDFTCGGDWYCQECMDSDEWAVGYEDATRTALGEGYSGYVPFDKRSERFRAGWRAGYDTVLARLPD